jgi:hypothetical protein
MARLSVQERRLEDRNEFLGVRSCLAVHSEPVHICTEISSITLGILHAKSDSGASLQFDCRPMALPYPHGRRLEGWPERIEMHMSTRQIRRPG